jgi:hypothetical protein
MTEPQFGGIEDGATPPPDETNRNKLRAAKGWISDPPPLQGEPTPTSHIGKWRKMMTGKGNT